MYIYFQVYYLDFWLGIIMNALVGDSRVCTLKRSSAHTRHTYLNNVSTPGENLVAPFHNVSVLLKI